jgi:hypothetical protein
LNGKKMVNDGRGLTRKEMVLEKIQEKKDQKWQVRYGQAVLRALERISRGREISLGENEEEIRKRLEDWKKRVEVWVGEKEREGGAGVREKDDMEQRRERVKLKERERTGYVVKEEEQAPRTLSQDELERLAVGAEEQESATEDQGEERKIQRKERRMNWYKEREGDSGKEERAIYESRQRRFNETRGGDRRTTFRGEREERPRGRSYEREGRSERGRSFERGGRDEYRPRRDDYQPRVRSGARDDRRRDTGDQPRRQATWENSD